MPTNAVIVSCWYCSLANETPYIWVSYTRRYQCVPLLILVWALLGCSPAVTDPFISCKSSSTVGIGYLPFMTAAFALLKVQCSRFKIYLLSPGGQFDLPPAVIHQQQYWDIYWCHPLLLLGQLQQGSSSITLQCYQLWICFFTAWENGCVVWEPVKNINCLSLMGKAWLLAALHLRTV